MKPSLRHYYLHGFRVASFATVLLLIRWQHQDTLASMGEFFPTIAQAKELFGSAAAVTATGDDVFSVSDEHGKHLGSLLQTSPHADHIIGFSGPTNVMVAFDADDRVAGWKVVSSGDTRDHLRRVVSHEGFVQSFVGLSREELLESTSVDAVSGATLTSLAIRESLRCRLTGKSMSTRSLRFPEPLTVENVLPLFPTATSLSRRDGLSGWKVWGEGERHLGWVLATSPAADNLVGFQGPTKTLIGFGADGHILGFAIASSYDNEPYVGYLREDDYFRSLFNEQSLDDLAATDLESNGIEGVSGATMTSMAVTEGLVLAARAQQRELRRDAAATPRAMQLAPHDAGTLVIVCLGVIISMTSLRSNRIVRVLFPLILFVYLGLIAGNLVSQAMLVGWAQYGVPWQHAVGLVALSLAAFTIPVTTRKNSYCSHLCPHGAIQQLVRNRFPGRRVHLHRRLRQGLAVVPPLLLAWCIFVPMTTSSFSLVDIEPFDAYVLGVAGWASITIAVGGLLGSLFVPMGYCRFGCPTGLLLKYLRFNASSDRWSWQDSVATGYVAFASSLYFFA